MYYIFKTFYQKFKISLDKNTQKTKYFQYFYRTIIDLKLSNFFKSYHLLYIYITNPIYECAYKVCDQWRIYGERFPSSNLPKTKKKFILYNLFGVLLIIIFFSKNTFCYY